MAFPIIPKKRSGATGSPTSLTVGELAVNTATGELFLGGDTSVLLLNPPTAAGTTVTEYPGDGTTTAFTFSGYNGTANGGYLVSVGGIDQPPSKYSVSATAGGTLTFVEAPVAGELISIRAIVAGSGGGGGADIGGRAWSATATYSIGDMVYINGVFPDIENYVSIQDANTGNNPYSTSGFWKPLTANATFLQSVPISTDSPANKNTLIFSNGLWQSGVVNAAQLQDQPISAAAPTAGNLLRFDGTNWAPFNGYAIPNWVDTTVYYPGDVVWYNGKIWNCVGLVQTQPPGPSTAGSWVETLGINSGSPSNQMTPVGWLKVQTLIGEGWFPLFQ